MRMPFSGTLGVLVCAAVPTVVAAGVIHGTLKVPMPVVTAQSTGAYPGQASSLPGGHPTLRGMAGDGVIYLDRYPAAAESLFAGWNTGAFKLAQKGQAFVPRVLAIPVGAAVDFPNMDPIFHNVFSLSPVRRFDLGKYPQGSSRRITFPKAGLVNVYCDIHSDMEAFLLVLPNAGFVRPGADGAFKFPDLPAGRYRVRMWHPDYPAATREIEIPARGNVTCDFAFGP